MRSLLPIIALLAGCVAPVGEPDDGSTEFVGELSIDGELAYRATEARFHRDEEWISLEGCQVPLARESEGFWLYSGLPLFCGSGTASFASASNFSADGRWLLMIVILDGQELKFIGEERSSQ